MRAKDKLETEPYRDMARAKRSLAAAFLLFSLAIYFKIGSRLAGDRELGAAFAATAQEEITSRGRLGTGKESVRSCALSLLWLVGSL